CPESQVRQVRLFGAVNPKPIPVLTVGTAAGDTAPTVEADSVSSVKHPKEQEGSKASFYEAARPPAEGRSGGPLVDRRGYLIGICSGTRRDTEKGYYLFVEDVRQALNKNGFRSLTVDAPPAAPEAKKPSGK